MKKVSVVIPAYNEEQYLPQALQALNNQTFPRHEIEIIVVDNASDDATRDVARLYEADVVLYEPRRGTNIARQRGLDAASGEIVAFLDADCVPPPNWIERIFTQLHADKQKTVAIAGAYVFNWDKGEETMVVMEKLYQWIVMPTLNEIMGTILKRGGVVIGGNFASFKKNFLKMRGFDTRYTFFGDDASIAKRFGELGCIKFDPTLTVTSSTRRFRREGLLRTNIEYAKHYFKVMFQRA